MNMGYKQTLLASLETAPPLHSLPLYDARNLGFIFDDSITFSDQTPAVLKPFVSHLVSVTIDRTPSTGLLFV